MKKVAKILTITTASVLSVAAIGAITAILIHRRNQRYLVNLNKIVNQTNPILKNKDNLNKKASELKEEDREEYENLFEEGEVQEEISSSAINSWLFNRDTIKIILETVMQKGLKVEGGDKLRKNYNIC